jgi:excisionase family DNA binding protein
VNTHNGAQRPTTIKGAEDLPAWMTIPQVSEYHNVDDTTTRRWIAKGFLTAHRVGPRLIRVERESVLKLGRQIGGVT